MGCRMEKFIPIVNRKECCKVWLDDVVYIENEGRRVKIVTDLSPYFDSDERFYPCMKGMVVNFDRVSSMKDQIIYFRNGMQYMLGRTNYLKTKQTFVNYMTAKKFD